MALKVSSMRGSECSSCCKEPGFRMQDSCGYKYGGVPLLISLLKKHNTVKSFVIKEWHESKLLHTDYKYTTLDKLPLHCE